VRGAWQRRKRLLLIGVAIIASAIGIAAYATGALYGIESQSVNARFAIRGSKPALVRDFAVVQIDDWSITKMANAGLEAQWPFPRRYHATVIDRLLAAGAKLIAFDVQFTEQTDPTDDNALINAVNKAHNMVLATTIVYHGATNVFGGGPILKQIGARVGNSTVIADNNDVLRDTRYSYQGLPMFSVEIADAASGRTIQPTLFGGPTTAVPIDYAGPPGTVHSLSYYNVYRGKFNPAAVRGKIVIIGTSAPTLQDVHETPTSGSNLMDGPEVQANIAASVLAGLPLRNAPGWINLALIILFGAAAPLATLAAPVLRSLLGALTLAAVFTVVVQLAFNAGKVVAFTYPLAALVLATLGTLAVVYVGEAFERERVRTMFARFVPAGVVDEVLARTDGNLRLGGVERVCTVMFSDVRGFTTFSESQPAAKVIEVINYYLNEMTEAILDAGGTLIAYLGDGILAIFGAPLDQPDHADRALAAAREMIGPRLQHFNRWMISQGYEQGFRMGIGLNTGPLMVGNVGSEQRVEYTAIGDTVNTGSRLEGLTKGTPYMLFLSETTRELMTNQPPELIFVDELEVRGRQAKLRVWSLPDPDIVEPEAEAT
jgi:adenylate cyclase